VKANQKAVRGVPTEINELNEPVKSISEATIDLGKVVAAVKDFEKSGQTLEDDIKAQILKNEKEATTILEETGRIEILPEERFIHHLRISLSMKQFKTNLLPQIKVNQLLNLLILILRWNHSMTLNKL
jgi:hypothetical protein